MSKEVYRVAMLDGGMVTNITPRLMEDSKGLARTFENLDTTRLGIPTKRPGTELALGVTANNILALYEFSKTSSTSRYILAAHGTILQRWDTGTSAWIDVITGLTISSEYDFLTFADSVLIANFNDASRRWDGTTVTTPTAFPKCKFLAEFRLRVVAAGIVNEPNMVWLSHTGDPTKWDPALTGSNAVKIYVGAEDGDTITGILNTGEGGMIIGKHTKLYGLFGYTRANFTVEPIDLTVGVGSHRSMLYVKPYAYFVNNQGIYRMPLNEAPHRISTVIQDVFEANTDYDNLHKSVGFLLDRTYVLAVPKVGGGYTVYAYNTEREKFSLWTNLSINQFMYVNSTTFKEVYFSEPNSKSVTKFTPGLLSDKGVAIPAVIELDLDADKHEVEKDFDYLFLTVYGATKSYRVNVSVKADSGPWKGIAWQVPISADKDIQQIVRIPIGITAHVLRVRIENDTIGEDLIPLSLTYVAEAKEVL